MQIDPIISTGGAVIAAIAVGIIHSTGAGLATLLFLVLVGALGDKIMRGDTPYKD